jgi:riboflavin biosynthesis pyrimidine reductase
MAGGIAPLADTGARIAARELIAGLALRERGPVGDRPRVVAAMIASIDGRAAVAGRSVALGHPQDRALLRGLRASADAVLVGAATVRAERYRNLFDGEAGALVAVITRSGDVPWEVGLFAEPASRVVVYSGVDVAVPGGVRAQVEVRRAADPAAVLADLHGRGEAELVLCEGGPRLLREVVGAGLLDDLVFTLAPLLVAGDAPSVLSGAALDPPAGMTLAGTWRADDHLFCHYTA